MNPLDDLDNAKAQLQALAYRCKQPQVRAVINQVSALIDEVKQTITRQETRTQEAMDVAEAALDYLNTTQGAPHDAVMH